MKNMHLISICYRRYNFIFFCIIIVCFSRNSMAADPYLQHVEAMKNMYLSRPLIDYQCEVKPAEGEPEFQETIKTGTIIFAGMKISAPITITYGPSGRAFNGVCEWDKFPYRDWKRYYKQDERAEIVVAIIKEIQKLAQKCGDGHLSIEKLDEDLQNIALRHKDVIKSIEVNNGGIVMKETLHTIPCIIPFKQLTYECTSESTEQPLIEDHGPSPTFRNKK